MVIAFSILLTLTILIPIVLVSVRQGKQASKELAAFVALKDLPECIDFFYSRSGTVTRFLFAIVIWAMLVALGLVLLWPLIVATLQHPSIWIYLTQHSNRSVITIVILGITCLAFSLVMLPATKRIIVILVNIKKPAVKVCRNGYQYSGEMIPWRSVASIETKIVNTFTGKGTATFYHLIITHKRSDSGKLIMHDINYSAPSIVPSYFPECMKRYWSTFGASG